MARHFTRANTEYLEVQRTPVVAAPFTMGCWCRTDVVTTTNDYCLMQICDKDIFNEYWRLNAEGDIFTGEFMFFANDSGAIGRAQSTTIPTVGTWYHVCGIEIASNSRAILINGGDKATNATNLTPDNADSIAISYENDSTPGDPWDGDIAEAFLYNVALTDREIWQLAHNKLPPEIRPQNLVGYWPLRRSHTWDRDMSGRGYHTTPMNTPTWSDNPPVLQKLWLAAEYRKYRRLIREPLIGMTVVWGHDTGVLETVVRNFDGNWAGTGTVGNPGVADTERLELSAQEDMVSEVVFTDTIDVLIDYNVYSAGDDINLDYRHGATEAACLAAAWNDYTVPFASLGYVQAKVTSTL